MRLHQNNHFLKHIAVYHTRNPNMDEQWKARTALQWYNFLKKNGWNKPAEQVGTSKKKHVKE